MAPGSLPTHRAPPWGGPVLPNPGQAVWTSTGSPPADTGLGTVRALSHQMGAPLTETELTGVNLGGCRLGSVPDPVNDRAQPPGR